MKIYIYPTSLTEVLSVGAGDEHGPAGGDHLLRRLRSRQEAAHQPRQGAQLQVFCRVSIGIQPYFLLGKYC